MLIDRLATASERETKIETSGFEFGSAIPKHWAANNPVITSFFNAVSSVIPEGEKFFIHSIRYYEKSITDPELLDAVKLFIHQEDCHSQQHHAMNDWLSSTGYPSLNIEDGLRKNLRLLQSHSSPDTQLAGTVAMEHVSTILSETLLNNPELSIRFHPEISRFFKWHSKEELEHKSVAYDVYQTTNPNYWHRVSKLIFVSLILLPAVAYIQLKFLLSEKQLFNVKAWSKAHWYFWVSPGYFRKMMPGYFRYYRNNFHPSDRDLK